MKTSHPQKQRQSNIELLRVISMLFILIIHSNYMGINTVYQMNYNIEAFIRFFIEAIGIIGVNCFILISGYFGIRLRKNNLAKIIFQTYFFSICALLIYILQHGIDETSGNIYIRCLFPLSNYIWFLPCYLLLMLFSPILNKYLEQTSIKKIFILTSIIYGITYFWTTIWKQNIGFGGYSFNFFLLLYMIGHLIRRYREEHIPNKWLCLSGYLSCVIILMITSFIQTQYKIPAFRSLLWNYDCPIVLAESIFLFIFFTRIDIGNNKFINWVGQSCFAVLLVHIAPCSTYNSWLQIISDNYRGFIVITMSIIVILGYYSGAILLDQIRLFFWNKLSVLLK